MSSKDNHNRSTISGLSRSFKEVSNELANRTKELESLALRYEIALEAAPTAMIMVDQSGKIVLINKQTEILFGYSRDELIGESVHILVPDMIRSEHPKLFASFFTDPKARSMGVGRDLTGQRKDGAQVPVEIGLNPIKSEDEVLVMASIVDITERKQLEAHFRLALEAAPTAMIMVDQSGKIVLINKQTEILFGYSRDELIGESVHILVPDMIRSEHPKLFASFFTDPKARSMGVGRDLTGQRKDGAQVPVEIGLNPIKSEDEVLVMASIVDITERKQLEAHFRLAVEAAPNAMIMVEESGKIILINKQTEILFGYSRDELIGESVHILVPDIIRTEHPKLFASFFKDPKTRSMGIGRDLTGQRKDGSQVPIEIGLNPIQSEGKILVMASIVNITERKKAESLIKIEQANLQRVNDELSQFAYRTSHDLKSPLTTSKQLSEFIYEDIDTGNYEEAKSNSLEITKQMKSLENLVTNILSLTKAELADYQVEKVDFIEIVEQIKNRLSWMIKESNCSVEISNDLSQGGIYSHKTRLTQILENLISNGIKYRRVSSEASHVRVTVSDTKTDFSISIQDNGLGIPSDYQKDIFKMFTRFHADLTEGTGLGLSLVKKHVDYLNGTISCTSSEAGTCFEITIPKEKL